MLCRISELKNFIIQLGSSRAIHCSVFGHVRRRGTGDDVGVRHSLKQLELTPHEKEALTLDVIDEVSDLNMEMINEHLPESFVEANRQRNFINKKIIEQKYFKDLYKIKPGEVYNRKKDPYFKRVKSNTDFHHHHHYSTKKLKLMNNFASNAYAYDKAFIKAKGNSSLNPISICILRYSNQGHNETPKYKTKMWPESSLSINRSKNNTSQSALLLTDNTIPMNISSKLSSQTREHDIINGTSTTKLAPQRQKHHEADVFSHKKQNGSMEMTDSLWSTYNGPCLLLWSMKEQLRYLHDNDPEHWTPQMLSLVFPIAPDNVKLLLKSSWYPRTPEEVSRHDRSVLRRWQRLGGKKLGLGSDALVRKAIDDRLRDAGIVVSSVPVLSSDIPEMMEALDKLQFEEPESARRLGVAPNEPQRRKIPKIGLFADIINNYKAQLESIKCANQLKKSGSLEDDVHDSPKVPSGDIAALLPDPPKYDGRFIHVKCEHSSSSADQGRLEHDGSTELVKLKEHGRQSKGSRSYVRNITYEEFIKQKEERRNKG